MRHRVKGLLYIKENNAYLSVTSSFNLTQVVVTGVVPAERKLAQVVPVLKNDSTKGMVTRYRPISILPAVSKLLKRHVSDIITDHVCENFPISDHERGFVYHHSSTSAHIAVLHDWLKALDDGYDKFRKQWGVCTKLKSPNNTKLE